MNRVLKGVRAGLAAVAIAAVLQVGSITLSPLADAANTTMTATTAVNVRTGPGTEHAKVGLLRAGQKVEALSTSGGWTKVVWNGATAWIASAYLTGTTPAAAPSSSASGTVAFTTANLNLRVGPSLSDAVAVVATKGTKLSLTGRISGGYTQVTHNGKTLWAASTYLAEQAGAPTQSLPAVAYKVRATAALMIRTAAGPVFTSLGDVPRGTILDATGTVQGGTAQVIWQGNLRWVNAGYITKVTATTAPSAPATPPTTTQYATTVLNVWHAATGSAYTGTISRGSAVAVTGKVESGRAEVVHDGAVRWVTARYLAATPPAPSAPVGSGGGGSANVGDINKGWSSGLHLTNANVQKIAWHVWNNYPQIKTQYGWRRDVTPDHPAGRAVDVMIPSYKANQALGWEIANYFRANAKAFNINYVIFGQKIWSVARDREGWRSMASRGNDTANHYDHVHINTYG